MFASGVLTSNRLFIGRMYTS